MKSLSQLTDKLDFLSENAQAQEGNTHLRHLEDLPLYRSADVIEKIIRALSKARISVKMDGSPSIFCGRDEGGKFFVSKKSIFNKKPIVYTSAEQISQEVESKDLASKFNYALKYLSYLTPGRVIQGDYLYSPDSRKEIDILGKKYLSFQSNTLVYGVEPDHDLAKRIQRSEIGVAFHTAYKGQVGQLQILHGDPHKLFEDHVRVWTPSPYTKNQFKPSEATKQEIIDVLRHVRAATESIKWVTTSGIGRSIENYHNALVRTGHVTRSFDKYNNDMIAYFQKKFPKHVSILKEDHLKNLFTVRTKLRDLKDTLITDMSKMTSDLDGIKVFIKKKDGTYTPTKHEGFVVTIPGVHPIKIVNRLSFSRFNFDDQNIERGWSKNGT